MAQDSQHDADRRRDAERLRALEDRLSRARGDGRQATPGADKFHQANQAWRMVIELVAGLGIGFGIGYGLDQLFGTTPILLVIFILLGFAAGVKTMLRTAAEMAAPGHGRAAPEQGPDDPAGQHPAAPGTTKGTERGD